MTWSIVVANASDDDIAKLWLAPSTINSSAS